MGSDIIEGFKVQRTSGQPVNFKEWLAIAEDRPEWKSRAYTRNLCLLPSFGPSGFMRVNMNIALRKRTLSPFRLVLEDSSRT
jgi:hypothetical protein